MVQFSKEQIGDRGRQLSVAATIGLAKLGTEKFFKKLDVLCENLALARTEQPGIRRQNEEFISSLRTARQLSKMLDRNFREPQNTDFSLLNSTIKNAPSKAIELILDGLLNERGYQNILAWYINSQNRIKIFDAARDDQLAFLVTRISKNGTSRLADLVRVLTFEQRKRLIAETKGRASEFESDTIDFWIKNELADHVAATIRDMASPYHDTEKILVERERDMCRRLSLWKYKELIGQEGTAEVVASVFSVLRRRLYHLRPENLKREKALAEANSAYERNQSTENLGRVYELMDPSGVGARRIGLDYTFIPWFARDLKDPIGGEDVYGQVYGFAMSAMVETRRALKKAV